MPTLRNKQTGKVISIKKKGVEVDPPSVPPGQLEYSLRRVAMKNSNDEDDGEGVNS